MSINTSEQNGDPRYEEFLSDSTECPTCRGLGRIKKDNEELVALIPVSDARLKPRKTILYVGVSVVLCALTAFLLLFFLISRSVTLQSDLQLITPTHLSLDNITNYLTIQYQVPINITNENYLPVKVSQLQLQSLLYGEYKMNTSYNSTVLSVPMRATRVYYVTVEFTLGSSVNTPAVVTACQSEAPILWKLGMDFDVQAQISYLTTTEMTSVTLYNRKVCCHLSSKSDMTNKMPPYGLDCLVL